MGPEIVTAIIAASSALAGAALTVWVSRVNARDADRRADARDERRAAEAAAARDRELAGLAADKFLEHLIAYRKGMDRELRDPGYDNFEMFIDAWGERLELELRHIIDRIPADGARRRLQRVIDGTGDVEAKAASGLSFDGYVLRALDLGRELSMAAVRGQDPDEIALAQFHQFTSDLDAADAHRELQRAEGHGSGPQ